MSIKIKPIMELSLFAIIVLLVVILYMQSDRFAKLNSEINAVKRRLDLLLEKKKETSSVSETKVPPVLMENTEEELSLSTPVKDKIQSASEVHLPENGTENNPEPVSWISEEVSVVDVQFAETEKPEKETEKPAPVFIKREKAKINYEKFIGENLFGKIGILVLVVGVGLFVKYAIDKDWINETMRTILGFVAGAVLLFVAERLCEKYRTFSSLLASGAFAVFYLTVAIAFHYYNLFSQTVAFIILVFVTLMMSILAILYDRRELAVISLVGGFIAPFLVSSGEGSYIVLFTYLSVLNLGMFGLSLYKKWAELPVISFVATYLIFLIYVLNSCVFYNVPKIDSVVIAQHLFVFATLFYFIFLLPVLTIFKAEGKKPNKCLLPIIVTNNFISLVGT